MELNLDAGYLSQPKNASDLAAIKAGCYFDLKAAMRPLQFLQSFCRVKGKPFKPFPWQWERILAPLFGWKRPDGTRRFRSAQLWIPKKNGKSYLGAAIGLYLLLGDQEDAPEIYSAAGDRKQASIIYNEALKLRSSSPAIQQMTNAKMAQRLLLSPYNMGKYEVLSAQGFRNEGLNIHGLLFDELHVQPDRRLWDALRYGGRARTQPLTIVTSTVGAYNPTALWTEQFNKARAIEAGTVVDYTFLPCVYAMDDGDDWLDPKVWEKCNPSWNHCINKESFAADAHDASLSDASKAAFIRYSLNGITSSTNAWMDHSFWLAGYDPSAYELPAMEKSYIGLDFAETTDVCAAMRTDFVLHPDRGQCIRLHPALFVPERFRENRMLTRQTVDRYSDLINRRMIAATPGHAIDYNDILPELSRLETECETTVSKYVGDKFHAQQLAISLQRKLHQQLSEAKIHLTSYNCQQMNGPTKYLKFMLLNGRVLHDGNLALDWMFNSLTETQDSSGNVKLDKSGQDGKRIDGFAAICLALRGYLDSKFISPSRYNDSDMKPMTLNLWGSA